MPETRGSLNSLLSVLAKESGISLVGRVLGSLLQLATLVLLARVLSLDDYGVFVLGWTVAQLIALFAQLGLDKGVVKYGTAALHSGDGTFSAVLLQSVLLHLLVAVTLGAGLYFAAGWIATAVFHKPPLADPLRLLAATIPVLSGLHVVTAITRISKKMHYSVICEKISQPLSQFALSFLFIPVLQMGVTGAILALGASYAIGFVIGLIFSLRLYPFNGSNGLLNMNVGWSLIRYSMPTSMAAVFAKTNSWVDRLFIGYFLLAAGVGVYQAASKVSTLFMVVASVFHGIFAVLAADLTAKQDRENLSGIFRANTKWGLYVALPLFLVILFHADAVMQALFGGQFIRGGGPLVILSAGQLVNIGTGSVGLVLMMGGQQNRWMVVSASMFVVNIVGNIFLIPLWGLWGAAIATSVSVATMFIIGVFMARKYIGVWPYDRRFAKGLFAALITCAVPLATSFLPEMRPIHELLVNVPLIVAVYAIALIVQGLDEDDRWVLARVRAWLGTRPT